jgi:hypothetical protein
MKTYPHIRQNLLMETSQSLISLSEQETPPTLSRLIRIRSEFVSIQLRLGTCTIDNELQQEVFIYPSHVHADLGIVLCCVC